jgi:hypothetical protein
LSKDGDLYKSQAKQAEKLFSLIQKQYKPLKDVKDEKPVTLKEGLKSIVGGAKSIGSRIKGAFQSVKNDPLGSLKNVAGKAERKIANVFDTAYNAGEEVLATDKDFTVKRGRFAQEGVKAGKFKTEEEGIKAAKRLERREAVSEGRKNQLAESEKYGFVNEGLRKKLNRSEERKVQDDPRLKPLAKLETAPVQTTPPTTAKVEKSSIEGKPLTDFGEVGVKREMARVETKPDDQAKKEKEIEAANLAKNPNADNVQTSDEIIAHNSKEDLQISKDLLKTTQESLKELQAIKEALTSQSGSSETKKEDNVASVAPAAEESGPSLNPLDFLGQGGGRGFPRGTPKIPRPAGKPSLGGRILGGIKGAGGNIFKGAGGLFSAGGAVAAATTIGGGLALNYGLTKGADAITEAAGADTNITPEMEAQDQANWDKASFFEKAQSGVARGIEGVGSFLGADKTVAAAKASRIKNETEYLKNKEAKTTPVDSAAGSASSKTTTGAAGFPLQSEAKPIETVAGKKVSSDKLKVFNEKSNKVEEYNTPEELDNAVKEGKVSGRSALNAKRAFDIHQRAERTAKLEEGQVAAMQPTNEVTPSKPTTAPSAELQTLELQNKELERDTAKSNMSTTPIIMNNSSNNTKNNFMPMKTDPRPSSRGSALDKYLERTSSY